MGKIATAANNAVSKKEPENLSGWLRLYKNQIAKALPSVITPERFVRMAMTALTGNPKLQNCTPETFIGAALTAAQLGLEPNTPLGQAYLIPYGTTCQFQVGYKGLLDLANRSGLLKNVTAQVVYENDEFEFEFGLEPKLKHKPAMSNRGKPLWVYATYHLTNGGYNFEVMSMDDVRKFAKEKSKSYNNGPWQTDFEAMAKKTVLKKVLKYAPLKSETASAVAQDGGTFNLEIKDDDVNVIPVSYEDAPEETAGALPTPENDVFVDSNTGEVVQV